MATRRKSEGFGLVPSESGHHFLVTIPGPKNDFVYISEHFTWDPDGEDRPLSLAPDHEAEKLRVILTRDKWEAIAGPAQEEFNRRLKKNGLKAGRWKTGQVPLSPLLGKELVLLAWAIEDADPALIPNAIKNWLGLSPEERWWLFTMTNAATGHAINGRNKGWRKAIRYALTENPVSGYSTEPRPELFTLREEEVPWSSSASNLPYNKVDKK